MNRLFVAGALIASLSAAEPALAAAYGVVIGIDDYKNYSDLAGAVNDADDIAKALQGRGADVVTLYDEEATRSRVVNAIRGQLAKTVSGDVVIVTYAGHGVQTDEALIGDEADGKDESFALYGFSERGPGVGERLRDNDVAYLLSQAPEGVSVLFVADSCHSGTMTRAPIAGGEVGATRNLELGPIDEDPLAPPDDSTFQTEASDLPHVVFAAAARDNQQTPEVRIDGEMRGALSWTVARAISGDAPLPEGEDALPGFREFVRAQVRAHSGARQTPDVEFDSVGGAPIARFLSGAAPTARDTEVEAPTVAPTQVATDLALAAPPKLFITGGEVDAAWAELSDVAERVDIEEDASLIWRAEEGVLIDRLSADMLAETKTPGDVAAAVVKWRAVAALARWSPLRGFDFAIEEGDERHQVGEKVRFAATPPEAGPDLGRLTIFNLASKGEVQYVYPPDGVIRAGKDILVRHRDPFTLGPATVQEPVGADHLIAVVTVADSDPFRAALRAISGERAVEKALALLARHAADPAYARVAVLPLFTERP